MYHFLLAFKWLCVYRQVSDNKMWHLYFIIHSSYFLCIIFFNLFYHIIITCICNVIWYTTFLLPSNDRQQNAKVLLDLMIITWISNTIQCTMMERCTRYNIMLSMTASSTNKTERHDSWNSVKNAVKQHNVQLWMCSI